MNKLMWVGISLMAVSAFDAPVWAKDSSAPMLEEIVVTAERREQNLQKAALTIQVLDGEQIASKGVSTIDDLNKVTTGLQIGMFGPNAQIFIRGVGASTGTPLINPGVTFNVDDIYIGRPDGMNGFFYDVARIEVLKGPQGTLYGRNANGGAINVITNEPQLGVISGNVNLEAGNYDYLHGEGAMNVPLGEKAALRGAFNIVDRKGYLSDGTVDDVHESFRLRFKAELAPDITLKLNGDYTHFGGKGTGYVYIRPGVDPYLALTDPDSNAYREAFSARGALVAEQLPLTDQDSDIYGVSAQVDWQLGDFGTLTVLPAYRKNKIRTLVFATQRQETDSYDEQKSVEVRLANTTERLTWTVGGFYYNDQQGGGIDVFAGPTVLSRENLYEPETKAYAVFAQATASLFDNFRLIAGGRYTYEDNSAHVVITNLLITPPTDSVFDDAKSFNSFTYKVGAEYDMSPTSMVYATYSTGYKAGGFSQAAPPINVYDPEELDAVEIGSRNTFLDNRLLVNVSAFHWDYSDLQDTRLSFDSTGAVSPVIFNSGNAEIYGVSFDTAIKITSNSTLSLNGEYNHAKYDSYFYQAAVPFFNQLTNGCPVSGPYPVGATLPFSDVRGDTNPGPLPVFVGDCSGFQVARAPKWSGMLSYDHIFPLSSGGTIALSSNVKYSGARWLKTDFVPVERDGSYAVLDASLTYESPDGSWLVSLWGRNLTESVYYTGGFMAPNVPGLFNANIGTPRTYGIRVNFRFGD